MHGTNRSSAPPAPPVVAPPVVHPTNRDAEPPQAPPAIAGEPLWAKLPIEACVAAAFLLIGICIGLVSSQDETAPRAMLAPGGSIAQAPSPHGPVQPVGLESTEDQQAALSASDLFALSSSDSETAIPAPTLEANDLEPNVTIASLEDQATDSIQDDLAETIRSRTTIDQTPTPSTDSSRTPEVASEVKLLDEPSPPVASMDAVPTESDHEATNSNVSLASNDILPLAADLLTKPLLGRKSIVENALSLALPAKATRETSIAQGERTTSPKAVCEDGTCTETMESHGTELQWADTPSAAYQMAGIQNKLVFLIHVSGNFEIPGFT